MEMSEEEWVMPQGKNSLGFAPPSPMLPVAVTRPPRNQLVVVTDLCTRPNPTFILGRGNLAIIDGKPAIQDKLVELLLSPRSS